MEVVSNGDCQIVSSPFPFGMFSIFFVLCIFTKFVYWQYVPNLRLPTSLLFLSSYTSLFFLILIWLDSTKPKRRHKTTANTINSKHKIYKYLFSQTESFKHWENVRLLYYAYCPFGDAEKEHHAQLKPGPAGTPLSLMPGFLWQKKSHLALCIILNMIMYKQGKKTISKELCIDCLQWLQEMEIQFEKKWCN